MQEQHESGRRQKKDMIEQIRELTMRRHQVSSGNMIHYSKYIGEDLNLIIKLISIIVQEPKKELLKPTKLNLFGLDIRFRYTDEIMRKERESKNKNTTLLLR